MQQKEPAHSSTGSLWEELDFLCLLMPSLHKPLDVAPSAAEPTRYVQLNRRSALALSFNIDFHFFSNLQNMGSIHPAWRILADTRFFPIRIAPKVLPLAIPRECYTAQFLYPLFILPEYVILTVLAQTGNLIFLLI